MQTSDGFRSKYKERKKHREQHFEIRANNHFWARIKKKSLQNQNIVFQKKKSLHLRPQIINIFIMWRTTGHCPLNIPNLNRHCFVSKCGTNYILFFFAAASHFSPVFFPSLGEFGFIHAFISGHFSVVAFAASVASAQ